MKGKLKTILAALGVVFVIVIALSVVVKIFSSGATSFGDKVAILEVKGLITDPTDINAKIREFAERDDVKAVVVRIDSPGGAVGPSQEIYSELKKLKATKKVVASMGSVAASGGYYIAVAADSIVANPGTITGSIGVIIEFINIEELFKKIGLGGYVVKSGAFKDTGSPLRKMSEPERRLLQGLIDDVHRQFIEAVAEGRGMETADVERLADGRILSGAQAKEAGLIDSLGTLADAIELSAELAGIEGKPSVIYPEKPGGLLRTLFGEGAASSLEDLALGARVMYKLPGF